MALRIRRGTEAQRLGTVAELGELLWVTDQKKLYVGTGATNNPGNASMANILETSCGPGISWNATTQQIELGNFAISSDDVTEGIDHLFFTPARAQSATATLFANGAHTGISYVYNDVDDAINSTVNISLNGLSNVTIVGTPASGQILKYDTVTSKWIVGTESVVNDTTPSLGGNLDLNNSNITGTGDISITGTISNTSLSLGDEITGAVPASTYDANIDTITNVVPVGSATTPNLVFVNADREGVVIRGNATSTYGATIELQATRKSGAALATVVNNDILGVYTAKAYNGSEFKRVSVMQTKATSNVSGGNLDTDLELFLLGSSGSFSQFTFKSTGLFNTAGVSFTPLTSLQISTVNTFAPVGSIGYNSDEKTLQLKTGSDFVNVATVTSVPSYSDSPGEVGQIAGDSNFVYFCYAQNSWTRVAKDGTFGPTP